MTACPDCRLLGFKRCPTEQLTDTERRIRFITEDCPVVATPESRKLLADMRAALGTV